MTRRTRAMSGATVAVLAALADGIAYGLDRKSVV